MLTTSDQTGTGVQSPTRTPTRTPTRKQSLLDRIRACGIAPAFGPRGYEGPYKIEQEPRELAALVDFLLTLADAGAPMERYLEIGVGHGGLIRFLCESLPIVQAFVIDCYEHEHFFEARTRNLSAIVPPVVVHAARTQAASCAAWLASQPQMDLVCIDAEHTYESVRRDTYLAVPAIRQGGWLFFHDTVNRKTPGVVRWVNELRAGSGFGADSHHAGGGSGSPLGLTYMRHFGTRFGLTVFRKTSE